VRLRGRRAGATGARASKWREARPPNHHDDKVDSDQQVVNKELSLLHGRRAGATGALHLYMGHVRIHMNVHIYVHIYVRILQLIYEWQEGGGDWGACIEVRGGALNLAYSTVSVTCFLYIIYIDRLIDTYIHTLIDRWINR